MTEVLTLKEVSCSYDPLGEPLLKGISFSLGYEKIGLVGSNGSGKTTLLRLILKILPSASGSVTSHGRVAYLPQTPRYSGNGTVGSFLGIDVIIKALARINAGSTDPHDFDAVGDHWDIETRAQKVLVSLGLEHLDLNASVSIISGGEATRLQLGRLFLEKPDLLLLDEPTNNLDSRSKTALISALKGWSKGLLVVSHDRDLLEEMDGILELSSLGLRRFGGGFSLYKEQSDHEQAIAEEEFVRARQSYAKEERIRREKLEALQRRAAHGKKTSVKRGWDKITRNSKLGRAQRTQARTQAILERSHQQAEGQVAEKAMQVKEILRMKIDVPDVSLPAGKIILRVEDVNLHFPGKKDPIFSAPLSFTIQGPQRICLAGDNGRGKTTLINMIRSQIQPSTGTITLGANRIGYIDQRLSGLDPHLSILDNFRNLSPRLPLSEARIRLSRFLFPKDECLKPVHCLSGGELLRAHLACILGVEEYPELVILDEPTNHLDLDGIEQLEDALEQYRGAIIVVSHDHVFVEKIGLDHIINLNSLSQHAH